MAFVSLMQTSDTKVAQSPVTALIRRTRLADLAVVAQEAQASATNVVKLVISQEIAQLAGAIPAQVAVIVVEMLLALGTGLSGARHG